MDYSLEGKPTTTILQLNDDCLEEIFKYLHRWDQLECSQVCQRFRGVGQMLFKPKSQVLEYPIKLPFQIMGIKNYMKLNGTFYQECEITTMKRKEKNCLKEIIQLCPNIKRIRFIQTSYLHNLKDILDNMNLIELQFVAVHLGNEAFSIITRLPKLEALSLIDCELNATNIEKLINLKKLVVHKGILTKLNFTAIFQSLRELEELCVKNVDGEINFSVIAVKCPKIHTLSFPCNNRSFECERIGELQNLKHLELADCYPRPTESLLAVLAENQTNTLEYLNIAEDVSRFLTTPGKTWTQTIQHIGRLRNLKQLLLYISPFDNECLRQLGTLENLEEFGLLLDFEITNDEFLDFLQKCRKLKRVNIKQSLNINNEFIKQVSELQIRRQQKLVISIEMTYKNLQKIDASKYFELDVKKRRTW